MQPRLRSSIGLAALVIVGLLTLPALAVTGTRPTLQRVESYLEGLKTLQADFLQAAPNGEVSTGTFILERPGKLRFDYAAPREDFIVADGTFLHFWDGTMQQQSSIPIGQTLADFILREEIDLGGTLSVTDLFEDERSIRLSVVQKDQPGMGTLTLLLSKDPLTLQKWRVEDAQGGLTEVALSNLTSEVEITRETFEFVPPTVGELNE